MTQTPLINEELFKQHSPITANTDITEFVPYICIAQELHIEPLLGQLLMEELKEQILNNTLSEANSNLIIKLAPTLAFYSIYQALPFHWATIANKGITIRESENSKGIDISDLSQLRRWLKDDADVLKNQLVNYLNTYGDKYPLWRPVSSCCTDHGKASKTYDTGFYFSKSKVKRNQ